MNNNLAYDFSKFEEKQAAPQRPQIEQIYPKVKDTISLPKVIFGLMSVLIVTSMLIYNNVRISEINTEIRMQQQEYDILVNEGIRLNMELESGASLSKVEEYASNVLGMVKMEKSQMQYIELTDGTTVEIMQQEEPNLFDQVQRLLTEFVENITGKA